MTSVPQARCLCQLMATVLGFALSSATIANAAPEDGATIFYDAHVFTADPEHPYAEAVAIRGDRIVAVGSLSAVEHLAGASSRRVDLKGRFLMPGMIDAHAHPIDGGLTLLEANFPDTSDSVPDLVRYVSEQAARGASRRGDVLVINS